MDLALSSVPILDPRKPIVSGLTASPVVDATTLRSHLVGLIPRPVVWSDCIKYLRSRGVEHSIFIGPGRALANLAKREGQAGGWVKKDVQGRPAGAGMVKLRTRAGIKQVAAPQGAQTSLAKDGQKPQGASSDRAGMDVLSVATEADYGRLRDIFLPRA